ncbi:hypothetical protein OB955_08635 [Halobacteria archaeon AArc-m2/3/4]|uniref:Uncharacterized protein n=2 Tax=Natronoglomus mannanivorans TaxID=2979990 RepID=A0AAP2YW10_9EURY|nr:hypothetical protein [Halobacteria archaeon AArc-xg1-1]MCU4972805.1 hypothetical protein [Halobacteria archaeon AArc-m2/3/4]
MMDLNDDLQNVGSEIEDVRTMLREETAELFEFDVVVGNVNYNANKNSVSLTVEPASKAQEQLSEEFGGVNVMASGELEFEYALTATEEP